MLEEFLVQLAVTIIGVLLAKLLDMLEKKLNQGKDPREDSK